MPRKGFTLIETVVVVSIIGILAAMLVPTISGMTAKARDGRRKSDIQHIALALELWREQNGRYPAPGEAGTDSCGGWRASDTSDFMQALVASGLLKAYPADPMNTGDGCGGYCYSYYRYGPYCSVPAYFYVLGARVLEGGADPRRANVAGANPACRNWADEFQYLTWGREDQ